MICCIIIITDLVIWRLMSFPVVSICRLSKPGKTNLALSALTSNLQLLKTFSQNASKVWWSRRLLKPGKTKLAPVHTGDQWLPPVHWALFLGFGPTTRDQPPFFCFQDLPSGRHQDNVYSDWQSFYVTSFPTTRDQPPSISLSVSFGNNFHSLSERTQIPGL